MLQEISYDQFNDLIKGRVFVQISATWCGPCKFMSMILESMEEQFYKINVDLQENKQIAVDYGFRSVPVIAIFEDGKVLRSLSGAKKESVIKDFINGDIDVRV